MSRNLDYADAARRLLEAVEGGDAQRIDGVIEELTHLREKSLFQELGTLTRQLHESLNAFRLDTRINDIVASEIPDARERLNYVITMTEQAADRTLTAIEQSMPLVDEVGDSARTLHEQWQRFTRRELSADEFRVLSREIEQFLGNVADNAGRIQSHLTDALMAQDFQDLTGQIIRRVINLVQEVEENLVQLVRISGARMVEEKREPADKPQESITKGEGPRIPGQGDDAQFVHGQDDVDDLLSSLGF